MSVYTHRFTVETHGQNEMHDITDQVRSAISESEIDDGVATVFVMHTTAAVLISEFEPGILADITLPLERIAPSDVPYRHNALNADDNAHSHLIGSIIGPSESFPFVDGRLMLGTWQRIVLIELDTHPRSRQVVVQIVGD